MILILLAAALLIGIGLIALALGAPAIRSAGGVYDDEDGGLW